MEGWATRHRLELATASAMVRLPPGLSSASNSTPCSVLKVPGTFGCSECVAALASHLLAPDRTGLHPPSSARPGTYQDRTWTISPNTGTKPCLSARQSICRTASRRTTGPGSFSDARRRLRTSACAAGTFFPSRIAVAIPRAEARTSASELLSCSSTGWSALSPNLNIPRCAMPPVVMAPTNADTARSSFKAETASTRSA